MNISELITRGSDYLNQVTGNNHMLAGAIGLWGLGVISYMCRSVPSRIYDFLLRHLTTELTVTSQNTVFHDMIRMVITIVKLMMSIGTSEPSRVR